MTKPDYEKISEATANVAAGKTPPEAASGRTVFRSYGLAAVTGLIAIVFVTISDGAPAPATRYVAGISVIATDSTDGFIVLAENATGSETGRSTKDAAIESEAFDAKVEGLWDKAKSEQAAGEYLAALMTVGEALGLRSDSAGLLALRDELAAQHESDLQRQREKNRVGTLVAQARSEIAAGDYQAAQSRISEGLQRFPDDETLQELDREVSAALNAAAESEEEQAAEQERQRIASEIARLSAQARSRLASEDYDAALAAVDEALRLTPGDTGLSELRTQIDDARSVALERARVAAEVLRLSALSRGQLEQGELEAALSSVDEALSLAPGDTDLTALRADIESRQQAVLEQQRIDREVAGLMEQAKKALDAEAFDQALEHTDAALALAPGHADLLALKNEIDAAEGEARERIRQQVIALQADAAALQTQGDYAAALKKVTEALTLAPEDAELMALGQSIQAQQAAEQERRRIASEIARLSEQARSRLASEDYDAALAAVDEALSLAPGDTDLTALRADIESLQLAVLEQQRIDREIAGLMEQAKKALDAEAFDRALEHTDAALALAPGHADLLALKNEIDAAQGEARERERIRQQVIVLQADAAALQTQGDYAAALKKVTEALTLAPEDADLMALGQSIQAQQAAEQERRRIASEIARLSEQARSRLASEDYDAALAAVDEALRLTPGDTGLSELRTQIDDARSAALERARVAAEVLRLSALSRGQLEQGELEAALSSVDEALSLAPGDTDLIALRADIESRQQAVLEQQRIDREVAGLMEQAKKALDAEAFDQALEHTDAALALAPGHADLLALKNNISDSRQAAAERERVAREVAALGAEARQALAAAQFESAQIKVTAALELTPGDADLIALRNTITDHQAALERERITQQTAPLIQNGNDYMKLRDIASARLFYEAAFDQGALTAATLIGMTYDPVNLGQLGVVGLRGNVDQALHWYGIGRDAGDPEAARRIGLLRGQ